jgi:PAS domain S-box-containing protein
MGNSTNLGVNSKTSNRMDSKSGSAALFEFATEGILIANEQGRIIKANPAAEKLFRFGSGELLNIMVEALVPQRYAGRHAGNRERFNKSPHARTMGSGIDLFAQRKDGTEFPVEISLSPYSNDEGKFVIAFIIDITVRKEAEQKLRNYSSELENEVEQRTTILSEAVAELQKIKEELNNSLAKEKELNELKSRFVSMVSHEFRTPLATILSSLALVRKYVELHDKEKQDKHMERIKTSVNNLTDILNDVLSLSKLEEGKITINPEVFNFPEFIDEVFQDIQVITKTGQQLDYINTSDVQDILLDRKILRHIVFNLVSNAVKFSAENKSIIVYTSTIDNRFELIVQDEGMGISEEDQIHLFESFYRGQNAINIQGTGLGLNIVSRYVDLLNGTIQLQSQLNIGTKFTIQLPFTND